MRAKLQQVLHMLIDLTNSKETRAGGPRGMVCTYSAIKDAKKNKVFVAVDVLDGIVQVGIELVFCLVCGGQGWGIGANEFNWPLRGMETESQQVF